MKIPKTVETWLKYQLHEEYENIYQESQEEVDKKRENALYAVAAYKDARDRRESWLKEKAEIAALYEKLKAL